MPTLNSLTDYSTTVNNNLLSNPVLSNTSSVDNSDNSVSISNISTKNFSSSLAKRRRPRRNPVWQYFCVENYLAVCKHCNYNTKSVFSTNLKVHLRSHHRKLFDLVSKAEKAMEINSKNTPNVVKVLKTCLPNKAFTVNNLKTHPDNILALSTLIKDANIKQNDKEKLHDIKKIFFNNNNYLQTKEDSFDNFFNKTSDKSNNIYFII